MNSREYYMLKKELDDIKDLLHKIIERQEKIELSGEVTYGEPHHIGRKEKQVNISLRHPLKQS
jgi:hypothetical protein